jgi:osmoprotectant transport system substrate-binding protein
MRALAVGSAYMEESVGFMNRPRLKMLVPLVVLAFAAAACGDTGSAASGSKGAITVGSVNTAKGALLGDIYGQALAHDGYTVTYKLGLGSRDVVSAALEEGQIDLYPGYAATELEYFNKGAGEATGDVAATTAKLNMRLQPFGLVALNPSPAVDQYAFAVTTATQTKYKLTKLSDLAAVAGQLTLGAGADCSSAAYCVAGLKKTYGISFRSVRSLDVDGPLTRAAFKDGSIDVGLVLSTDGDLNSLGLVVLQDDKHMENADNVVPILRQAAANDEVTRVLNAIDAKLTTDQVATMNSQVAIQLQGPLAVANAWLQQHNYSS